MKQRHAFAELFSVPTWPQRAAAIFVGIIVFTTAWWLAVEWSLVPSLLLPTPPRVGAALVSLLIQADFWLHITSTVISWLLGVLIGTLAGGVLGIALGLNKYIWAAAEPWVEFLRALPSVVLVPLVSLFLGVGTMSRVSSCAIVVAALLASTAGTALRSTSRSHLRLAAAWQASLWQTLRYFLIPSALSHMAVALKAAIPLALIVAVAADMLIATNTGIGKIIMDSLAVFDTPTMYAAVLVVGLLGYLASALGAGVERLAIHWRGQ